MNEPLDAQLLARHYLEITRRAIAEGDYKHAIAALNALLPDDDPSKIKREWVNELRSWARDRYSFDSDLARWMAEGLERYLERP
jgi:hypothetical protein